MRDIPNEVYIYGTGDFSKRIESELKQINIKVISFLEFDLARIRENVLHPNQVLMSYNPTVIVGVGNPEADLKHITIGLQNLGFNVILPVEISQVFFANNLTFENYWLTGNAQLFVRAGEKIDKARLLFKEKKSLDLFDQILDYRKNSLLESLPKPDDLNGQYMPSDLPWVSIEEPITIVDCGAFNGDTIQMFMNKGFTFESYFAFEPDFDNYELLQDFITKKKPKNIFSLQLATWSENLIMKFQKSGGNNSGAHLTGSVSNNLSKVLAVKLDDFLPKQKIDLIKMDIEGAEKETLVGLHEIISTYKPYLAISVYHKPEDLWEIPLLIDGMSNCYTYYLRVYGQQTFDTVLYCVPSS
jgi:FkbM family methyltransferase